MKIKYNISFKNRIYDSGRKSPCIYVDFSKNSFKSSNIIYLGEKFVDEGGLDTFENYGSGQESGRFKYVDLTNGELKELRNIKLNREFIFYRYNKEIKISIDIQSLISDVIIKNRKFKLEKINLQVV